jgi:hypothetical protein
MLLVQPGFLTKHTIPNTTIHTVSGRNPREGLIKNLRKILYFRFNSDMLRNNST